MSVGLQPSSLLVNYLQVERQEGLTLFKFTEAAQKRLEDLLGRRKDRGLTSDEQSQLDALAELDRIFTYINSQLVLRMDDRWTMDCRDNLHQPGHGGTA